MIIEVRQYFVDFFPSVELERVIGVSDWAFKTKTFGDNLPTASNGMVRAMKSDSRLNVCFVY